MRITGFLLLVLVLALSACSSNRMMQEPEAGSHPSHASLFYFMAGVMNQQWGQYNLAEDAFDKALTYDYRSYQIRKYRLLNSIYRYMLGEVESHQFQEALERSGIHPDELILQNLYNLYQAKGDSVAVGTTLSQLEAQYPNARIHLLRFIYDYSHLHTINLEALERSLNSNPEPDVKFNLARIYGDIDPPTAYRLVHEINESDPTEESLDLEEELLFLQGDYEPLIEYFRSRDPATQATRMRHFLDQSFYQGKGDLLMAISEDIIATNDYEMLESLALSALFFGSGSLMQELETVVNSDPVDSRERNQLYGLFISRSLLNADGRDLSHYSHKLFSSQHIESVLSLYLISKNTNTEFIESVANDSLYQSFFTAWDEAIDDPPLRAYLESYGGLLRETISEAEFVAAKTNLARTLIERGFGGMEDFLLLISELDPTTQAPQYITLLRQALERNPGEARLQNALGYTLIMQGELEEGAALVLQALDQEPESSDYLDSYAWYLHLKGDQEAALAAMQIPMQLENMPAEIAYHIAEILLALDRKEEALVYLRKAMAVENEAIYPQKAEERLREVLGSDQ